MAGSSTRLLPTLARLALDLQARRKAHEELRISVEAAAQAGVFVAAERDLLAELQELLAQADTALAGLTSGASVTGAAVAERLAELEEIANDIRWEVAGELAQELAARRADLEARSAAQQAQAREQASRYQKEISDLLNPIAQLERDALNAFQYGAAVREERRTAERLRAVLTSAERLLAEGKFSQVDSVLQKLREESASLPGLREYLKETLREARLLARQADLLLIRAHMPNQRYEYTLLLRTPGEQGTAGLDIQDESTLVEQDHRYFEAAMDEIAAQINDGLVRSFNQRVAAQAPEAAAETTAAPPPVAEGAGTAPAPAAETTAAPPPASEGVAAATEDAPQAAPAPAETSPTTPAPAPAAETTATPPPAAEGAAAPPTTAPGGNGAGAEQLPPVAPAQDADQTRLRLVSAPTAEPSRSAVKLLEDIGDFMYRLVIPETMQLYLTETKSSLTIRTNDVELPWELMRVQTGRGTREFLCLERPVARMPTGRAFPRRETTKERPEGRLLRFLLIYSDPDQDYPLSSAEKEIDEIKAQLGEQVEVMDTLMLQDVTGRKLNRILLDGEYDVIHYAGHAAFDKDKPDLSGLLLWEKEVFFAQKVRRLLEGRPLVFVNACESGRTANEDKPEQLVEGTLQRPAEGILSSFIYGGATCCVGSIWPVYDGPAREFAVSFYRRVLEGMMVGEAMRQTRLESRQKYERQVTWASYVLYGDPTARLAK